MAINSASTLADIKDEYLDNLDYESSSSPTKAEAFINACRALLLKLPAQSAMGSGSTQFSPNLIREELNAARAWLSVNQSSRNAGVKHLSFEGFRR